MTYHDEVAQALKELGEQHRTAGPPPHIEARLRAATRRASSGKRVVPRWVWACAACLVLTVSVWQMSRNHLDRRDGEARVEQLSEFIPVPGSEALPEPVDRVIIRVQMAKEDLRSYGFEIPAPVGKELVRAEFIVGEDGLARAVRFVL